MDINSLFQSFELSIPVFFVLFHADRISKRAKKRGKMIQRIKCICYRELGESASSVGRLDTRSSSSHWACSVSASACVIDSSTALSKLSGAKSLSVMSLRSLQSISVPLFAVMVIMLSPFYATTQPLSVAILISSAVSLGFV